MLALALDNARQFTREHRVADMLQAAFLPDIPDHLFGLDLAKAYSPGLREAQVGGDLYDAFPLPDGRVALVIADVSGKGLGAAVQTATVKYSLRAFAAEAAAPGLVLRRLNRTLRQEASGLGEHFVTLFYAVYDPATGRLTYASAGHEAQLIKRAAGGTALLPANGPILGLTDHIYEQDVNYLYPGDSLVLYTDGLTEARAAGTRELLELERVVAAVDRLTSGCGAGALVASLEQIARDWTHDRPQDDLALLVAQRCGEGPQAGVTPVGWGGGGRRASVRVRLPVRAGLRRRGAPGGRALDGPARLRPDADRGLPDRRDGGRHQRRPPRLPAWGGRPVPRLRLPPPGGRFCRGSRRRRPRPAKDRDAPGHARPGGCRRARPAPDACPRR